jgi:hypothetical protein
MWHLLFRASHSAILVDARRDAEICRAVTPEDCEPKNINMIQQRALVAHDLIDRPGVDVNIVSPGAAHSDTAWCVRPRVYAPRAAQGYDKATVTFPGRCSIDRILLRTC